MPIVKKIVPVACLFIVVSSLLGANEQGGGPDSSSSLTKQAWDALNQKDYRKARQAAQKCRTLYGAQALNMQKALRVLPGKDTAGRQWALNDVGTCGFILGQVAEAESKRQEAVSAYREVVEKYGFAQCWDPQGWYWQVSAAAQERLAALALNRP